MEDELAPHLPSINLDEEREIALSYCGGSESIQTLAVTDMELAGLGDINFMVRAATQTTIINRLSTYVSTYPSRPYCELEIINRIMANAQSSPAAMEDTEVWARLGLIQSSVTGLISFAVDGDSPDIGSEQYLITRVYRPAPFIAEYKALRQWESEGCTITGVRCRTINAVDPSNFDPQLQGSLWSCKLDSTDCDRTVGGDCGHLTGYGKRCVSFSWGPVQQYCRRSEPDRPQDQCPADPAKTQPGACGCGVPDHDTDLDGVVDCADLCPQDPAKSSPGKCGCGVPDADSDLYGVLECFVGPTPVPSGTPSVSPSPSPTGTPFVEPTATPMPTGTPFVPPSPSPFPSGTPFVGPTTVPWPTSTPSVMPTPLASPTATPTEQPTSTPSPSATPTPP